MYERPRTRIGRVAWRAGEGFAADATHPGYKRRAGPSTETHAPPSAKDGR
jgi:hypothetical protein